MITLKQLAQEVGFTGNLEFRQSKDGSKRAFTEIKGVKIFLSEGLKPDDVTPQTLVVKGAHGNYYLTNKDNTVVVCSIAL